MQNLQWDKLIRWLLVVIFTISFSSCMKMQIKDSFVNIENRDGTVNFGSKSVSVPVNADADVSVPASTLANQ